MPMRTSTVGTPREDLVGAYEEFNPEQNGFVADLVYPEFEVGEDTGVYGVIPVEAYTTGYGDRVRRAPKSARSRSSFAPKSRSWSLEEHSHEEAVDYRDKRTYGTWFDAEEKATKRVRAVLESSKEQALAEALFNPTAFPLTGATGLTVANEWDDPTNGRPITDIGVGIEEKRKLLGLQPWSLLITYATWQSLSLNEQILDRLKYTSAPAGLLDVGELTRALGVNNIRVAGGVVNGNAPGATGGPSMGNIFSDEYALLYVEGSGDLSSPQLGRRFRRRDEESLAIASYEEGKENSVVVYAEDFYEMNTIHPECAFLFGNVNTI